jgi:hypothetical protein
MCYFDKKSTCTIKDWKSGKLELNPDIGPKYL